MPTIVIRNLRAETMRALDAHAAAAGSSREAWLRAQLEWLASAAIVRDRFRLVATGPGQATATIRRRGDGERAGGLSADLSQAQATACNRAQLLVEQNGPGDRERAIGVLATAFDTVLEGAG